MKIALDAMGGDLGPPVNVQGAINACREWPELEVVLVGDQSRLIRELKPFNLNSHIAIRVHHASTLVDMHESPVEGCRSKPDSSIMICAKLLSEGAVDGMVSAGNSGATMTASLLHLRRIEGISRPAIAAIMPTLTGQCVM